MLNQFGANWISIGHFQRYTENVYSTYCVGITEKQTNTFHSKVFSNLWKGFCNILAHYSFKEFFAPITTM